MKLCKSDKKYTTRLTIYQIGSIINTYKVKGCFTMEKRYSKRKSFWALMGALILVIASTGLLVYRYCEEKAHYEKWKDYDECGIQ